MHLHLPIIFSPQDGSFLVASIAVGQTTESLSPSEIGSLVRQLDRQSFRSEESCDP